MLSDWLFTENYYKSIIDWDFINYLTDKLTVFEDKGEFVNIYFMALLPDGTTRCIYFGETNSWSNHFNYKPYKLFYGIEVLTEEDLMYDSDGSVLHDEYVDKIMDKIRGKAEVFMVGRTLGVVPIQSKFLYYNP